MKVIPMAAISFSTYEVSVSRCNIPWKVVLIQHLSVFHLIRVKY
jgi:hypothetical protein